MEHKFLEQLIKTASPSGAEQTIQKKWLDEVKPHAEQVYTDMAGNAVAVLNQAAPFKVMLAGHCDEIAFMVKHIDKDGFIYLAQAGSISPKVALGMRLTILGTQPMQGIIGVPPEHKGGAKDELKIEDIFIDVGAKSDKELADIITVGDYAVYDVDYTPLCNRRIAGRGLDNRTGAYIVAEVIKALAGEKLNVGVYGVSTVNEETTMGGAYFAAQQIAPSLALALDVTFATDAAGGDPRKDGKVTLGGGPVLSFGSQISRPVNDLLKATAKKHNHALQYELTPSRTGTDADRIRFTGKGVPVALVSLPLRYMHSPSEVVSLDDIEAEIAYLVDFIKDLSGKENLKPVTC